MRKIAANIIYPVSGPPIKNGYLVLNDQNEILDVSAGSAVLKEIAGLEYYSGVLIPGFVNAHCHLELSHLSGHIEPGQGLESFIKQVPALRSQAEPVIAKAIASAYKYMWSRGINGLGDVVNTPDSIPAKQTGKIKSHSFLEVFSIQDLPDSSVIQNAVSLKNRYDASGLSVSYAPHSLYGTSQKLREALLQLLLEPQVVSLHFKEHRKELDYDFRTHFSTFLAHENLEKLLLVHNIYLKAAELDYFEQLPNSHKEKIYWTLCPNSNLYIEKLLPPVGLLLKTGFPICLGTDSLASNKNLSVFDEMKTLAGNFPELSFTTLLQWATLNGAKALNMETTLGSFEPGKKPGVLLIEGFDFKKEQISQTSRVSRLV